MWAWASGLSALAVAAPFAALAITAAQTSPDLWAHLIRYVLPGAALDTAVLLTGVGAIAIVTGTLLAWFVTAYDFKGRRVFEGALLLPLAMPTYIVAYAYLDLLHPVGPVQETLRWVLGFDNPRQFRLPDVRSMSGCIVLLGFVLYPYVYLPTRALFLMQSASLLDTARTLGCTRLQVFWRVALPLARPAVAAGASLALMEALNDIGASEFLGVRTMTVSIYSTWVTRSDLAGAAQLAMAMLAVVVGLVALERWARRHQRFANDAQHPRPLRAIRLSGWRGLLAFVSCLTPVAIGFLIPTIYLVRAAAMRYNARGVAPAIWRELITGLLLSLTATLLIVIAGVIVAYASRIRRSWVSASFARVAAVGYATPGTVVAIGLLPVFALIDAGVGRVGTMFGVSTGLVMLGSGLAILYAYGTRFLAIPIGGAEAALSKISRSLDDAAATLGAHASPRFWRVHLPLMRPAVATAALLVFVDCMKELPATLLLRPLGVETLATHLYGEAARGTYEDAAIAALLIVVVGLLPVWMLAGLTRGGSRSADARELLNNGPPPRWRGWCRGRRRSGGTRAPGRSEHRAPRNTTARHTPG